MTAWIPTLVDWLAGSLPVVLGLIALLLVVSISDRSRGRRGPPPRE